MKPDDEVRSQSPEPPDKTTLSDNTDLADDLLDDSSDDPTDVPPDDSAAVPLDDSSDDRSDVSLDDSAAVPLDDSSDDRSDDSANDSSDDPSDDPIFAKIQDRISRRTSQCTVRSSTSSEKNNDEMGEDFQVVPHGLQPREAYKHARENMEIIGLTYNGRQRQFVILDPKGILTWRNEVYGEKVEKASRCMSYDKHDFRLFTNILYAKKYNVYFALGKDFSLKVLNRDFEETCSVTSQKCSVLHMVFNPVKDELITGGIGGVMVWKYHQVMENSFKEIKTMANYRLDIKYRLKMADDHWVKRLDLDLELQHLYCCSDTDLHAYDLEGRELFHFTKAHDLSITGCAYSSHARLLLTASVDTTVRVWSITGGLIHTLRGHSRAVTNLMMHPLTSALFITSSLDGSVRIWSLDTMDVLYKVSVSRDGVLWMGMTDQHLLYVATTFNITTWSLNLVTHFWALAHNRVTRLALVRGREKTTRVLALSEEGSVRLFGRHSRKNLSTVLPPPSLSPLSQVQCVSYNRVNSLMAVLVNSQELWLYTTRTDPACRVAVWDLRDIQNYLLARQPRNLDSKDKKNIGHVSEVGGRAVIRSSRLELPSVCCSVCCLDSEAVAWTDVGPCSPRAHQFMLLGLEDGRILFMDPVIKGKQHMEVKASRKPITGMFHDTHHQCLLVQCRGSKHMDILVWSLPDMELCHQVHSPLDVTVYVRLGNTVITGHESGHVILHPLLSDKPPPSTLSVMAHTGRADHESSVLALDGLPSLEIFCTASGDGIIKVWTSKKTLLTEITVEASLTSACFLNYSADLLIGYKNHIFRIDHTKVCPYKAAKSGDSCDEESVIYEDPAVRYEGIQRQPDPINLRNYLVPFDIKFAQDFMEGKLSLSEKSEEDAKEEEARSESGLSAAPTDIYNSPLTTPRLVDPDLQLTGVKDRLDSHRTRPPKDKGRGKVVAFEDEADQEVKRVFEDRVEMPIFGESPGPSPQPSTPSVVASPPESPVMETFADIIAKTSETETQPEKPKERAPVKAAAPAVEVPAKAPAPARVKEIHIDSRALMKEAAKRQPAAPPPQRAEVTAQKPPAQVAVRPVAKKQQSAQSGGRRRARHKEKPPEKQKLSPAVVQCTTTSKPTTRAVVKKTRVQEARRVSSTPMEDSAALHQDSSTAALSPHSPISAQPPPLPSLSLEPLPSATTGAAVSRPGQGSRRHMFGEHHEPMMSQRNDLTSLEEHSQEGHEDDSRMANASGVESLVVNIPQETRDSTPPSRQSTPTAAISQLSATQQLSGSLPSDPQLSSTDISPQQLSTVVNLSEGTSLTPISSKATKGSSDGDVGLLGSASGMLPTSDIEEGEWATVSVTQSSGHKDSTVSAHVPSTDSRQWELQLEDFALRSDIKVEKLRALRPHTAHALPSKREDLERLFYTGLNQYQTTTGTEVDVQDLYRNDGVALENYSTKTIERHQLLRIHRRLRVQSAHERRHQVTQSHYNRQRSLPGHQQCVTPIAHTASHGHSVTTAPPTIDVPPESGLGWWENRRHSYARSVRSGAASKKSEDILLVDRALSRGCRSASTVGPSTKHPAINRLHSAHSAHTGHSASRGHSAHAGHSAARGHSASRGQRAHSGHDVSRGQRPRPRTAIGCDLRSEKANLALDTPYRSSSLVRPSSTKHSDRLKATETSSEDQVVTMPTVNHMPSTIPSKCTRYLLVTHPNPNPDKIIPTPLEERLIPERFPEWTERWLDVSSRGHEVATM